MDEYAWMAEVAHMPCMVCKVKGLGASPAEVHHIFSTSERSNWLVVPLCPTHHRGSAGFHFLGQRAFERMHNLTEAKLMALTIQAFARRLP